MTASGWTRWPGTCTVSGDTRQCSFAGVQSPIDDVVSMAGPPECQVIRRNRGIVESGAGRVPQGEQHRGDAYRCGREWGVSGGIGRTLAQIVAGETRLRQEQRSKWEGCHFIDPVPCHITLHSSL
jgi:hypothetical protein